MKLIVVRHYKTQINAQSRIMGWGDSPPVNGWERDMLAVSERIHKAELQFDCVYTSKLKRARNTGEFYSLRHDIQNLFSSAALNEVNYGKLFSKSKKWVAKEIPEYKTDPDYVFPEGESFNQMKSRSVGFIQKLVTERTGQTVLVVAHAGVIRGLICHYLNLPYAPNLKRRISHQYIGMFKFDGHHCRKYDELGSRSDFTRNDIIAVPHKIKKAH